jgi:hypothetical protein
VSLGQHIKCRRLAKLLDVSPKTICNWVHDLDDPLPSIRVKGTLLFDCETVSQWLKEHKITAVDLDAMVNQIIYESRKE